MASSKRTGLIILTAVLAFTLKVTMAMKTVGTNDIVTWRLDATKVKTEGWEALYRDGVQSLDINGHVYPHTQVFSHPPSMIHMILLWDWLANKTSLPLEFWVRLFCSMADVGSLWLLYLFSMKLPGLGIKPVGLLLFAASPILLMVSGFHGNTDPILMFFLLASVYLVEVEDMPVMAGVALGLALSIKIVAIIFAPAILFFLPGVQRKFELVLTTVFMVGIAWSPYILDNPVLIARQLSHYSSQPHIWGLSLFTLASTKTRYEWIDSDFLSYGKIALLIMLVVLPVLMNRKYYPLFIQCGVIAFFFMFFTPGFAVQYLVWLTPWIVVLGVPSVLVYDLLAGNFLLITYTHWCRGFPWYYANAYLVPQLTNIGLFFGAILWVFTGITLLMFPAEKEPITISTQDLQG